MGSLQVYKDNVEVIPKRGLSTFLNMGLFSLGGQVRNVISEKVKRSWNP